jgi:hypothetical protein
MHQLTARNRSTSASTSGASRNNPPAQQNTPKRNDSKGS